MLTLYDLAGEAPDCRFSPYCWRIKTALTLKGLPFETVPVRFTDKPLIAFSGQDKVPVLRDGEKVVADSGAIATYLDEAYPDTRPLIGASAGLTTFVRQWTEWSLHPRLTPLILMDIYARIAPADRSYFRQSREARFGRSLEEVTAQPDHNLAALREVLNPLRATLKNQPYVAGAEPAYADCIVFGAFQWARVASPVTLVEPDDPIAAWRERMLDIGNGLGRATPAAAA